MRSMLASPPPAPGAVRLTVLGSSDAFNAGGRAHSCYWVDDGVDDGVTDGATDGAFTVDFGPTSLLQCKRLGLAPERIGLVVLTHLHGDHIGGLPVLLLDQQYRARRTAPLLIAGPPGTAARLAGLMTSQYPDVWVKGLLFPVCVREWDVPGRLTLGARTVSAIAARHDPAHHACSIRIETGGRALAFSGDTGWQPSLATLAAGADLFVCECTDRAEGYASHLSLAVLERERAALTVRRLVLTHLGEDMRAAAPDLRAAGWELAEDGDVYAV